MSETHSPGAAMDGVTTHVRYAPFKRRFAYPLAQILIDIDRVDEVARDCRFLGHNRFNLFSFHDRDHGDRSGAPLRAWAEARFADAGVALDGGRIELLCFPRVLGYVFNPLSVFFGYGPGGDLRGVVYEVNNTFGETHAYVARLDANAAPHTTRKRFHVSPFIGVEGDYRFTLQAPTDTFKLGIENLVGGKRTHFATIAARRATLNDAWILRTFARLPFATLQVIFGIHWQALKLWMRGATYHSKPAPPVDRATVAEATPATSSVREPA